MSPETARAILNLSPGATREDIRRAFRLRSRMTHPDRFSGAPPADIAAATAEFIRIGQARDVLWAGASAKEEASPQSAPRQSTPKSPPYATPRRTPPTSPPPGPRPMGFEEFVRARNAASWTNDPSANARPSWSGSAASRAESTRKRWSTGLTATLAVALCLVMFVGAVIWVGVQQTIAATDSSGSLDVSESSLEAPAESSASLGYPPDGVEAVDEGWDADCGSLGCWTWRLVAPADCTWVRVSVEVASTPDGDAERSVEKSVVFESHGVATFFVGAEETEYARISAIQCHH